MNRNSGWRWIPATLILLGGLVSLGIGFYRVAVRMGFDYDLLLWADDYFMTSMLKLSAGLPVYTEVSRANSTVYSPGGPYLHYSLLAPFDLETSLLANRIVNQVWLAIAVGVGVLAVLALARSSEQLPPERGRRFVFTALSATVLSLCAYANPVADSLHPTNLELCTLFAAAFVLVRWTSLSKASLIVALGGLPAAALLAKQTAGVAVAAALSWAAWREPLRQRGKRVSGSLVWRLGLTLVPGLSLLATLGGLYVWTDGYFKTWGFDIVSSHPFHWWKVSDLYAGYFLLFVPSLIIVIVRYVVAMKRRNYGDVDWLRVFVLLVAYVPLALTALFKAMGGPNNLGVVGMLLVLMALPPAVGAMLTPSSGRLSAGAAALIAVQVGVLYPRRRVPSPEDHEKAELICRYAAARMRCGERVLLGRGSVCYDRGGVEVPVDRMNSILEVAVAGRRDELGFYDRVVAQHYDVMILGLGDLMWFGRGLWELMEPRYKPFFMTRGEREGDFWFHGWQGYVTVPTVFWERIEEAGSHDVSHLDCADL